MRVPEGLPPALRARVAAARSRLAWTFTWLPGSVAASCAGMVLIAAVSDEFEWWLVLPVLGALLPLIACQLARVEPPRWPHVAFLTAAGQLLIGAVPAYGMAAAAGASGPALPLFLLAWASLIAALPIARTAYVRLTTPLTPELGALPLELRFGVRTAIERADTITTGLTVGLDHVVAHARRHVPYSSGNPNQVAVPLREIVEVRPTTVPAMRHWLSLADGTPLLATPGPAVELRTRAGGFVVPTDDAALLVELIRTRCSVLSGYRP